MLFADSETQKLIRDTARSVLRDRYPWERLYALERGEDFLHRKLPVGSHFRITQ